MKDLERTQLMYAVLDGEATADEARALERLLAADAAARVQFEDLRSLFDQLSRVPKAFPPEGMVAAVMASVPRRPAPADDSNQLFAQSRVISQSSMEARDASPGRSTVHRVSPRGTYIREQSMNEQKSGFGRRKLLIGGGVAAVAALFAVLYITDSPPGMQSAVGTIVPAKRYLAPQVTEGVQPRDLSASGVSSTNAAAGDVAGNATGNATGNSTGNATGNSTGNATGNAAGNATGSAASQYK
jgi:anti-sigma factor RsiW